MQKKMETQPQRKQKQIEIYTYTYMLSNYPSLIHSIPKTQKEKCRIAMSCPFEFTGFCLHHIQTKDYFPRGLTG
jgi:hypothetical protein